jgi:predicted metal-dependent phosphoesterase TrpH
MFTDIKGKKRVKVGLHTHTTLSDGRKSPQEVMQIYADAGYDYLALTDHWVYGQPQQVGDMQVISGCEYNMEGPNTPDGFVEVFHIVGVGMQQDPGIPAEFVRGCDVPIHQRVKIAVEKIRAAGGLAILAHPAWSLNTPEQIMDAGDYDATEIFNSVSECGMSDRAYSDVIVDQLGVQGVYLPLLATDDAHYYTGEETRGMVMVEQDAVEELGLVGALRAGRFYSTQGPQVLLERTGDNEVTVYCTPAVKAVFQSNLVWSAGRAVRGQGFTSASYTLKPEKGERFVRVEVTDAQGSKGWSNIIVL